MLQTVQVLAVRGYVVVVSPGVRHLPELLSGTEITRVHGDIMKMAIMMEIFGLPAILTNIDFMKQINIFQNMTDVLKFFPLIKSTEQQ